jgi:hypothetical protein
VTQRRLERLRLLDRQLELAQPPAALDAEQVRHRRAALQAPDQHRVDLVLRPRPRAHQLLAPRQPPAQHPAGVVGHPDRVQLARRQQPRQAARIESVGLRPGLADPRVVGTDHDHPLHVRLQQPRDLPSAASHLERHPIVRAQAPREQLERLRGRLDPTRRAHRAVLRDRDLTEIAVHVQPDRPADRSHHILLASNRSGEPAGKRQRPIRARSTTRASRRGGQD